MSYRNQEHSLVLGSALMMAVMSHQAEPLNKILINAAGPDWQKLSDKELAARLSEYYKQGQQQENPPT